MMILQTEPVPEWWEFRDPPLANVQLCMHAYTMWLISNDGLGAISGAEGWGSQVGRGWARSLWWTRPIPDATLHTLLMRKWVVQGQEVPLDIWSTWLVSSTQTWKMLLGIEMETLRYKADALSICHCSVPITGRRLFFCVCAKAPLHRCISVYFSKKILQGMIAWELQSENNLRKHGWYLAVFSPLKRWRLLSVIFSYYKANTNLLWAITAAVSHLGICRIALTTFAIKKSFSRASAN